MANTKKTAPKLTTKVADHLSTLDTTSAKIRYLKAEGLPTADIARALNIRYQWVRNVLNTPLKGQ